MSKAVRKVLNISLEYTDSDEIQMALDKMLKDIKRGKTYERVLYSTSILEWSCVKAEDMDYEEKVINGKLCQVYQSSMNKKTR